MKKIMFNDQYGLTQAVLEGRKTQTRRILNPTMLFERLNTYEGWEKEDIADWKESCKDRLYKADGEELKEMLDYALEHSPYKVGENVAVAQRYCDIPMDSSIKIILCKHPGWNNKMFVTAKAMPHQIKITNIRCERLQDISTDDCLAEGIVDFESKINKAHFYSITDESATYSTPRNPFAILIDKISGKGTWASNPLVFVYDFKLIK